jgi:hypothetical protein
MSYEELAAHLRALEGKPLPPEAVLALRGAFRSARALYRALGKLVPHAAVLAPDELAELHDLLAAALAKLSDEFDIDD